MIVDLGIVDYEKAYAVQRDLIARRRLKEVEDSLIIAEHNAVITVGRSGRKRVRENLLVEEEILGEYGIRVLEVDRGGDITLHAPGQLVVYPIIDLKGKSKDLRIYMRRLEGAAMDCLKHFGIPSFRVPQRTGVWFAADRKIASIGIAATDWITYHGLSLNVNIDLEYFSMIKICGYRDVKATSMKEVLRKGLDIEEVKVRMVRDLCGALDICDADHEYLSPLA